jgi:hypothetical protein
MHRQFPYPVWVEYDLVKIAHAQPMAELEVEAAWRAELERIGETQHRDAPKSELNRQAAFRWSGDEAQARRVQEEQAHHYLMWIFFAAIGAVIAGLIAEGLTLLRS